ncbi:MAG: hypothetical protein HOA39_02880 [Gammaproteobacteria bacterium]|nr:hypothetical protein [Gammaproteobacteria bacterium]
MTVTRFLSSLLFSSAFIWVAVEFFDVETEVVYVLFIFSLILIGAAMVTGLLISPLLRKILQRPGSSLLSQLRAGVHDLADGEHRVPPMDDQAGGPEADRSQPSKGAAGPDSKGTAP